MRISNIIEVHVLEKDIVVRDAVLYGVDDHGSSLLHYAAAAGAPKCVAMLLRHSLKPNTLMSRSAEKDLEENTAVLSINLATPLDTLLYQRHKILKMIQRDTEMISAERTYTALLYELA